MHKKICSEILDKANKTYKETISSLIEEAYKEGYKNALYDYDWHKDGEIRVGSGFYSYKDALKNFLKDFGE